MTRKSKIIVGVVVAVAVVGVGAASVKSRQPKGTPVRTAKVGRQDLVSLITANGTLQAKTKVELSANVMGQVTQLNVEEGQAVKKGELLLVIDQARYSAAVDGSQKNLEALEAELVRSREAAAQAHRDEANAKKQLGEGIIAQADYDRAKSLAEQADASSRRAARQVEQAKADLASSRDSLAKTEIRAPIDGVVTRRNIEQGEVVVTGTMNNAGTVLMTISDMSTIEAVLEVDQTDMPALRLGQPASVLIDAYPDQTFPAVVSEIGSSPIRTSSLGAAATGTDYEVKVVLQAHPERVRPGLTVTADITTSTREKALTVPIGALVLRAPEEAKDKPKVETDEATRTDRPQSTAARLKDIEGVYLVKGGKVEFKPATVGIKGETDVEVLEGLAEGDEVVIGPFRALRDLKPGDAVRPEKKPEGGEK